MISAIDKAAKRGIIHKNAAKRRKARLNKVAWRIAGRRASCARALDANHLCISLRKVKIPAMIPASSARSVCGRLSYCCRAADSIRRELALEFRAAGCDRALLRRVFSDALQIHRAIDRPFSFRVVLNVYYSAPLFTGHIVGRYLALALGRLALASSAEPGLTQNSAPGFARQFHALLHCHQRFFLAQRSGLREEFWRLIQALTVGLPQYSATPTWMFFRNSLVSDLLFTVLLSLA